MSDIISTIADAIRDVGKVINSFKTQPKDADGNEKRFFERPTLSVARQAKKSILYFPVVTSESLSAETSAIIAKAVQVRAAEYVRLMISNMNPVENVGGASKSAVISSLRGATLSDDIVQARNENAIINGVMAKNMLGLMEHTFAEDGLRPALHSAVLDIEQLLTEAKQARKPRLAQKQAAAAQAAAAASSGANAPSTGALKAAAAYQRQVAAATAAMNGQPIPAKVGAPAAPLLAASTPLEDAIDQAIMLNANGTRAGREKAKQVVRDIASRHDATVISELRQRGLGGLLDELNKEKDG